MPNTNNILFDANSSALDSPAFILTKQITVIATGMAPDDYITFEILQLQSGDPLKLCGCRIIEGTNAIIDLAKPLTCSMCGPEVNSQEVRLTALGTFVIIDAPQGALMRAIYHGTGVDDGTVKAWYNISETPDLNDAMRGCAPLEVWEDTGETRCDIVGDILEIQQSSSCGAIQWVPGPALTWVPTGEIRCNAENSTLQLQEVNDCGDLRWTPDTTFDWVNTGVQDCTNVDGILRVQQISPCGGFRWTEAPDGEGFLLVTWLPTGEIVCDDVDLSRQERNQCGDYRLVGIGPVEWVPTGVQDCQWIPPGDSTDTPFYTLSSQEINSCGVLRWTPPSEPLEGFPTGETSCDVDGSAFWRFFKNPCGGVTKQLVMVDPADYWSPTGQMSCSGDIVQLEEQNPCGKTQWVEDPAGTPTWHNAGGDCSYTCDPDTGFLFRVQQSACCGGGERLVQVFVDGDPVDPEWLATGSFRCNTVSGMVELQERSQCNDYRWVECSPITWSATGETRIFNGVSQLQQTNPCGEIIWIDIPPESITWTLTGVQACVDGFYQNQETDGYGNVRTTITTEVCGCEGLPILQDIYDTDWQAYTGRKGKPGFVTTLFSFVHGLPAAPDFVTLEYRCTVAQAGYTVGQVVPANVHSADSQGGSSTGWAMNIDATKIDLAFDTNNGASLHQWNSTTNFRLDNNKWEFRIRGYV